MRTFDYGKLKERTWDSEILGYIAQIHEYKGRQELYLKQTPDTLHPAEAALRRKDGPPEPG